jgi:hypothetical protein
MTAEPDGRGRRRRALDKLRRRANVPSDSDRLRLRIRKLDKFERIAGDLDRLGARIAGEAQRLPARGQDGERGAGPQ